MPKSKKENKLEEKNQSVESTLETKKVFKKIPTQKNKENKITKKANINVEKNSELIINNIIQKPENITMNKNEIDLVKNNDQNNVMTENDSFNIKNNLIKQSNRILKKTEKKKPLKDFSKVKKNLIDPEKSNELKAVIKEIVIDKVENVNEIIGEKPQRNETNPIQKVNAEPHLKKDEVKEKNINPHIKDKSIIIKSFDNEDSKDIKDDKDSEYFKTENKYYKNIPKNKVQKVKEQLKKEIPAKLAAMKEIDHLNSFLENLDSKNQSKDKFSDLQSNNIDITLENKKFESKTTPENLKHIPKSQEEKLREKNERIEQARILNRMNQLRQNEERRLQKLKSQGLIPQSNETEKENRMIEKPEEPLEMESISVPFEKTEKIQSEKPQSKTEEDRIRERNERIEQARILNRINQLNRNKEKQQHRLQETPNKVTDKEILTVDESAVHLPESYEITSVSSKQNEIDSSLEKVKQIHKEVIKHTQLKDTTIKPANEPVKQSAKEIKKEEHISKIKENKPKPEHKKESKSQTEMQLEEVKSKKPIPDLILDYSIINPKKLLTSTQKNDNFLKNFYDVVENFLKKELFIEKGSKILVTVSGGVDSIVLLDCLAILSNKLIFNLYIAHFNHKLRGESSEKDEKFVAGLAQDYNLQFYLASGNVKSFAEKNSISIEHAARQLRYNFFERTARNLNVDFVVTAHTADDSAETFLINLLRGSGLTGLSGIPAKRQFVKNISIARPLISFHKKELFEYTKKRKLVWRQDESNALMNYTRNKIRLDLLPKLENEYNPSIIDTINRTSRLIYGSDEIVKEIVKKNITNLIIEAGTDKFSMKISMLQTFSEFLQGEFVQFSWLKYFRLQPLSLSTIDRILDLFNSQTGAVCEINSQFFAIKDRNALIFSKKIVEEGFKQLVTVPGEIIVGKQKIVFKEIERKDLKYNSDPNTEYFDGQVFEGFIELRTWAEGDSFQPLGMDGEIKISDFLINEKVPLLDKSKVLVLTNKIEIIWIVGKRISEKFKVKKTSKKIIKAEIIKIDKK